jgi:hypothetical protein
MESKTYTEEELQSILKAQAINTYGNQFFIEALAHTASLVRQGAFPQEAHQVGQMCYKQFMDNTQGRPEPEKKVEKASEEQV